MVKTVLVTGSLGLVGRRVCESLKNEGFSVTELDLRGYKASHGDITILADLEKAIQGCTGVVHLAAVSRVVWGQRDPDLCWRTNVTGLQTLVQAALAQSSKPWILFSSSREVYGQAPSLPVAETTALSPLNVYARSKAEGERIIIDARSQGLQTAVVRLSNVYGCTKDHADRVIPAFAKSAVEGVPLRVEGSNHTFDFTHVNDVTRGIISLIKLLELGEQSLPPVHLVTGRQTSLGELAAICCRLANSSATITESDPRSYDVAQFYGNPSKAQELLGWDHETSLEAGLKKLIEDFRQEKELKELAEAST